ncbi:single-stranded DNA-binding protein [Kitasatospora sp. NPDC090091]|uniref:single-stranded DNA-binding protein n=1 Tax=Kitasatospora sp. NPDC090091 TaxID=3364081 RepID=UPI00382573AC
MAGETIITLVGNLVDDPELRFTPSGVAVAKFRIASTPKTYDRTTGEWKDGDSLFLPCEVWRQPAENVAETLQRGMRVIVQGRLRQRSYETKDGEKRTVFELDVEEIGPSLRFVSATVTKNPPSGRRSSGGWGANAAGSGGGRAAPAGSGGAGGWGGGQDGQDSSGGWPAGQDGGSTEEPPF